VVHTIKKRIERVENALKTNKTSKRWMRHIVKTEKGEGSAQWYTQSKKGMKGLGMP
jgi:hypothetical protein